AEDAQLGSMQGRLNDLAGQINVAATAYQGTQQAVMDTRDSYQQTQNRYDSLRQSLDQRDANAYMEGVGTGLEAILGSTSMVDFSDRLQFLNGVAEHDAELANRVQGLAGQVHVREVALNGILAHQATALRQYDSAQSLLQSKVAEEKAIQRDLTKKQTALQSLVDKVKNKLAARARARAKLLSGQFAGAPVDIKHNPFHLCPVGHPHAFTDDFGAPRYTTNPPHPHGGNDILAPASTPIFAPFDGVATDGSGGLGGMAVIVTGADGYVYNAHIEA